MVSELHVQHGRRGTSGVAELRSSPKQRTFGLCSPTGSPLGRVVVLDYGGAGPHPLGVEFIAPDGNTLRVTGEVSGPSFPLQAGIAGGGGRPSKIKRDLAVFLAFERAKAAGLTSAKAAAEVIGQWRRCGFSGFGKDAKDGGRGSPEPAHVHACVRRVQEKVLPHSPGRKLLHGPAGSAWPTQEPERCGPDWVIDGPLWFWRLGDEEAQLEVVDRHLLPVNSLQETFPAPQTAGPP